MRVIAGTAKGRRLVAPRSTKTRPTSDLVRAAIFNMLIAYGADLTTVLDLYAGSGALGIEALSRGAGHCDFVERAGAACAVIRENLRATGLAGSGTVHCIDVLAVPKRLPGRRYTLVLADPPYSDEGAWEAVSAIAGSLLVSADTTLMLELSARSEPRQSLGPFPSVSTRRHGDTLIVIYARELDEAPNLDEEE